jgi:hypothetical protein
MTNTRFRVVPLLVVAVLSVVGCGDDDEGQGLTPAQLHGVGAACEDSANCYVDDRALSCLDYKGGYCGLEGCLSDDDCPAGSACVDHEGLNYCFLICRDKPECNYTRSVENESNCVSSITFVDGDKGRKACVPPS